MAKKNKQGPSSNGNSKYYQTLEIADGASDDEIKKAYRKLAMKYHPDRNKDPGAEDKFKEVKHAYEILTGEIKENISPAHDPDDGWGDRAYKYYEWRYPSVHTVEVSLRESVFGSSVDLPIDVVEECPTCHGHGQQKTKTETKCYVCGGCGYENFGWNNLNIKSQCRRCFGTGTIRSEACATCKGSGDRKYSKTIKVNIPAGIRHQEVFEVDNDISVLVSIKPDPIFTRDKFDIIQTVNIDVVTAILGDLVTVPTLDGQIKMKVPAGIQHGQTLRAAGKGVKRIGHYINVVGDMFVKINIQIPTNLTDSQKKLLQEFGQSLTKP